MYDAMKGKGNKLRSSLTDEHKQEALLTRKAEDVVGDAMCRFEGAPRLGFATAEQRLVKCNFGVRPLQLLPKPSARGSEVFR